MLGWVFHDVVAYLKSSTRACLLMRRSCRKQAGSCLANNSKYTAKQTHTKQHWAYSTHPQIAILMTSQIFSTSRSLKLESFLGIHLPCTLHFAWRTGLPLPLAWGHVASLNIICLDPRVIHASLTSEIGSLVDNTALHVQIALHRYTILSGK